MARLNLAAGRRAGIPGGGPARGIARILAAGMIVVAGSAAGNPANDVAGLGSAAGRVKSGTGFFVSPAGFLVTSRHVVTGCPGLSVWTDEGGLHDASLVAANARLDLALLSVKGRTRGYAASRYRDDLQAGEKVITVGFGVIATNPRAAVFTQGIFVGRGVMSPGYRVLIIRAHLRPGDSGAPVTDRSGSLIGMVIGRLADHADLGVIITASEINGFLSRGGIGPLARQAASFRSEDPGGLVARMSALVQCKPVARSRNPPRPPGSRPAPAREGTGAASGGRRTAALIRPRR